MPDAVIFDLDGLLTDTEQLHFRSYRAVLQARGVALSAEAYDEHWIRQGRGIRDFLAARALTLDADDIRRAKADAYKKLVRAEAALMPGARRLLEALHRRLPLGLATASYGEQALTVLEALDIRRYFDTVAASEDVAALKPDPEVFLLVARRLGVPPPGCVVLEDSEKGVRAARAAGMACVAVPNAHTRHHDLSAATLIVASLDDVTPALLDRLVATP